MAQHPVFPSFGWIVLAMITGLLAQVPESAGGTAGRENIFSLLKRQNREISGRLTLESSIVQEGWVSFHDNEPGVDPFRVYASRRSATLNPWFRGALSYQCSPVKNLNLLTRFEFMPETDQSMANRVSTNDSTGYDSLYSMLGFDTTSLDVSWNLGGDNFFLKLRLEGTRQSVRKTTISNNLLAFDLPGETGAFAANGYLLDPSWNSDLEQANQASYTLRSQRVSLVFTNGKPMLVEPWFNLSLESIEVTYAAFGRSNLDTVPGSVYAFSPAYLRKKMNLAAAAGIGFRPNSRIATFLSGSFVPNETRLNGIQSLWTAVLGAVPMGSVLSSSLGILLEVKLGRAGQSKLSLNYNIDIDALRMYPQASTALWDWALEYNRNLGILNANERDQVNHSVKMMVTWQ